MIRMYGFWRSAASFRVRIALNLKGLAYQETMIDLDAGEQHAPGYRASRMPSRSCPPSSSMTARPSPSPWRSSNIWRRRIRKPALLPADARGRSRVRSLALLFAADHHPLIVPRVRRYLADELQIDEARRTGWLRHWFREGLVQAERRLSAESGHRAVLPRRHARHGGSLPDQPGGRRQGLPDRHRGAAHRAPDRRGLPGPGRLRPRPSPAPAGCAGIALGGMNWKSGPPVHRGRS